MGLKQSGLLHGWPTTANSGYNGSQEIWNFVSAYSKDSYSASPCASVVPHQLPNPALVGYLHN
jgi:hypothetical protein